MQRTSAWILVAATVLLTALGQVLIKWQAGKMGSVPTSAGLSSFMRGVQLLLNPWVIATAAILSKRLHECGARRRVSSR